MPPPPLLSTTLLSKTLSTDSADTSMPLAHKKPDSLRLSLEMFFLTVVLRTIPCSAMPANWYAPSRCSSRRRGHLCSEPSIRIAPVAYGQSAGRLDRDRGDAAPPSEHCQRQSPSPQSRFPPSRPDTSSRRMPAATFLVAKIWWPFKLIGRCRHACNADSVSQDTATASFFSATLTVLTAPQEIALGGAAFADHAIVAKPAKRSPDVKRTAAQHPRCDHFILR